jgi:hypothetical protein
MVDINNLESIGMIETGSHSIHEWEVMVETDGKMRFLSHDTGEEDSLDEVIEMFQLKEDESLMLQLSEILEE